MRRLLAFCLGCGVVPAVPAQDPRDLARQVVIYRDTYGIPHVFGENDASTMFGFAYAQAEDNAWRIEVNYLRAIGRAAEVYGERAVPGDRRNRLLEIPRLARAEYARLPRRMRELVDAARRSPGSVAYGSYGNGTQPNLLFETLASREGLKFLQVPYKGIAPVVTAVVAGEVQTSVASPAAAGAMVKADKIKALAVGGTKRSILFPDVPTMAESGYPYVDAAIWWGLFAPAGTNATLIDRINQDVAQVARQPEFINKYFTAFGLDPVLDTPAAFSAAIREDLKLTAEMVKAAGVEPVQ